MTADIRLLRWAQRDRDAHNRLVAAIDRVRAVAARGRGEIVVPAASGPCETDHLDRARVILAHRQARDAGAGDLAELFGEPGWDILLTLFIAAAENRTVTIAQVSDAARLRPRALARWLIVLADRGLVELGMDAVALTDAGTALARGCIGQA